MNRKRAHLFIFLKCFLFDSYLFTLFHNFTSIMDFFYYYVLTYFKSIFIKDLNNIIINKLCIIINLVIIKYCTELLYLINN